MATEDPTDRLPETTSVDVTLQGLDVAQVSAHTITDTGGRLTWLRIGGPDARVTLLGERDDLWRALSRMAEALAETTAHLEAAQS
jgi:hypothetical protein